MSNSHISKDDIDSQSVKVPKPKPKPKSLYLPEILFGMIILGSIYINTGPMNLSLVDGIVGLIFVAYLPLTLRYKNRLFNEILVKFGTPATLYVGWGLTLLIFVGGSLLVLTKDAFSFAYFFVCLALLLQVSRSPSFRIPMGALLVALMVLFISTFGQALAGVDARPSGTFNNPNLTAAWFSGAFLTFYILKWPRRLIYRYLVLAIGVVGLLLTGSLGFILALLVALGFEILRLWNANIILKFVVGIGIFAAVLKYLLPLADSIAFYSISQDASRLDRSSDGRFILWQSVFEAWQENPFGLGPGGFSLSGRVILNINGAEAHNDYLGILADFGILGFAIWIYLLISLFYVAGKARAFVVFMAISSLTHSIVNYRSNWIFLALIISWFFWADQNSKAPDDRADVDYRGRMVV